MPRTQDEEVRADMREWLNGKVGKGWKNQLESHVLLQEIKRKAAASGKVAALSSELVKVIEKMSVTPRSATATWNRSHKDKPLDTRNLPLEALMVEEIRGLMGLAKIPNHSTKWRKP